MTDRFFSRAALVLVPLALAACGGGREAQADGGVQVNTTRRAAPVASGGDTSATSVAQPQPPLAGDAPVSAATSPATPSAGSGAQANAPASAPPSAPAPVKGGRQDANAILARVEQTAAGVRTLEADFVQNLHVPLLGSDRQSTGKLYQRKPDRFLMRFTDPAGDVMVADGRYFWIYYPSSDRTQVIRTSIAEGGQSVDLQQQFLSNPNQRFVATLAGDESVAGRSSYVLTLVPRGASAYKILKIWVDKEDYLVRRFEMTEENNSVRTVEMRNLRTNHALPDNLFTFTPPAGAQVFDQ
ncbi:outer membrane lipoprotein chaperone LolA [Longimicrobium sp.]|uniref:outer membrane lipoprotein chaperone LolA n=1 Tax=Longimicrobium sp. TaxID=2029185 RepID=UPI002C3AACA3|nr:outer membrane lipoprotein chaperone LolA [Longimicrobium sp.]HSU16997.1 outer membrane lipoprotein chaperone LolA [Longimicrobium sp.]